MLNTEIARKRVFWRRVLMAGILILVISLGLIAWQYMGMMSHDEVVSSSDLEREISEVASRRAFMVDVGRWILPVGVVCSLMVNVARYRLRKLKKLENEEHSPH